MVVRVYYRFRYSLSVPPRCTPFSLRHQWPKNASGIIWSGSTLTTATHPWLPIGVRFFWDESNRTRHVFQKDVYF